MATCTKKVFLSVVIVVTLTALADTAKIGAVVLDEENIPISGVVVSGGFENRTDRARSKDKFANVFEEDLTDRQGWCCFRGKTNTGKAGCGIKKVPDGYYPTRMFGGYAFTNKNFLGTWQPDNLVVTLKLQRVVNPIPLYAKMVGRLMGGFYSRDLFSKGTNTVSYDFMSGDWLPPAGTGVVSDVVFKRLPRESFGIVEFPSGTKGETYRDHMVATFTGEGNGLVEERVQWGLGLKIRTAQKEGFKSEWRCWNGCDRQANTDTNFDKNRCFSFRIRTKRNEKGEIVEAYYGKIYGDLAFGWGMAEDGVTHIPVAEPRFSYYLNPTSLDRNLEWNKVNLCKNPGDLDDRQP